MEVGSTLDEALALRHEHDDLLNKLNVSDQFVLSLCHHLQCSTLCWCVRFESHTLCEKSNFVSEEYA